VYGLPADFDASFFVGCTLNQIWFQEFSMQFLFGDDFAAGPTITLQSSYVFRATEDADAEQQEVPVSSSGVMQLVGLDVIGTSSRTDGTLRLDFEDGASIDFLDDTSQYEAYQIRFGDRFIVV
jgi:hypothetical protein